MDIRTSAYIIFTGMFIQLNGIIWDFLYHWQSGVREGLAEFLLVPAHDFIIFGFLVAWIGTLMLFRALRR